MVDELGNTESSYYIPDAPVEQIKAENKEKPMVLAAKNMLNQIIKRFNKQITFYDSIDSIEVDAETHPEAHIRELIANKQTKVNLTKERDYLQGLLDKYE